MSIMQRIEALRRLGHPESLDEPIGEDSEVTRGDVLEGTFPSPHEFLESEELERSFAGALGNLPPAEASVVRLRFGFDGDELPLEEIAAARGCARETVRREETRAIRKLRAALSSTYAVPPAPPTASKAAVALGDATSRRHLFEARARARAARMVRDALQLGRPLGALLDETENPWLLGELVDEIRAAQSRIKSAAHAASRRGRSRGTATAERNENGVG